MGREFVVTVDLGDGKGLRYMGKEMSILRAKGDAETYDLDTVTRKISLYSRAFPGKAFGMERAEEGLAAFKKENNYQEEK